MKINTTICSLTLSLALNLFICNFALAETKTPEDKPETTQSTDVKTDNTKKVKVDNKEQAKDKDDDEKEETEKKPVTKEKLNIGGQGSNAFTRKESATGTTVGGYFDTEFTVPYGGNSYFTQHHLILQASSLFNERLFFNSEVEFEDGGAINEGASDGKIRIEQAFLDYKFMDWLIFRMGNLLIPVGRLNTLHDSDIRDTTARPLFDRTIIPSTWTETGAGFYGKISPNDELEINYDAYVTQGLVDDIEDGKGLVGTAPSFAKDNNSGKALSSRIGISPFIGFEAGLSGYYSTFDVKDQKSLGMVVADFNYKFGPFELLGEGGFTSFSPADQRDVQGNVIGTLTGPMWGYYVEGHYKFSPDFLKFSILGKDFNNPTITLFTRIDQVDTDMSKLNENDRTQLCIGFNYRPITSVAFKFEYQINIENQAILTGDATKEKANNQFLASVAAGF